MNYQPLAEELAREEYKDLDDQAAADALNAETVEVRRPVPTRDIFIAAMRMGLIVTLRTVTLDAEMPAGLRALAQTALDLTDQTVLESVDMDDPASVSLLAGLMQYGLMTNEQVAAFVAMGTALASWAELHWEGVLAYWDVARARANHDN